MVYEFANLLLIIKTKIVRINDKKISLYLINDSALKKNFAIIIDNKKKIAFCLVIKARNKPM